MGVVWRLARRAIAAESGVSELEFKDVDPWREADGDIGDTVRPEQASRPSSGVKERVLNVSR